MAGKADDLKIAYSISVVIGDLSERRGIKIPRGSGIDAKAMQKIAFERVVDQIRTAGISVTQSKVEQIVKAHNLGTAKGRDAFLRPAAQQKRADARAAKAEAKAREKGVVKSNVDFARAIAARQAKIPYQAPKRAADKSSRARTQMPVEPPIKRSELRLARRLFPGISDKEAQANREHVRRAVLRGASSLGGAAGRRTDRFIETGYRGLASHTPGVSRPAPASITRMATAKYTPTPTYSYQASSSGALGAGATGSTARGTRFFTADQAAFMRSDPRAVRQYMKLRRSDAGRKITVTQRIPGSQSIPARTVSTPLRGAARAGKIVDLMRADRSVRAIEARTPAPSGRPFSPGTASGTMSTTRQSKESITQYSESRFSGNPEHEARIARLHSRSVSAAEKIFGQGPGKEGSDLLRGSAARNYAHAVESEQAKTGIRNINDPAIIKAIDARISSPSFEANVIRSSKAAIGGMDARDITGRIKELASSKNPADVAIAKQIVSDYMPGKIDVDKIASRAAKDREAKAKEPVKAAEPKKVSARAKPRTEEFKKHEKETQRRAAANAAAGKGEKPYPKATGDRLSIAKLAGLRAPMQTSSGFSSGPAYKGIISNDDIVGALKARAAGKHPSGMEIGSKKEIADRQMIANTIAGKVAGSQAVSGAPKAILEAFAADPKLAEFYLGQGATALTGVKGKDIERPMTKKEILDEFAAKSAKGAPVKKTKAPAAKKTPKPAPAPTRSATVKPAAAKSKPAAAPGGSGGGGGGGDKSRSQIALENQKARYGMNGGMQGKMKEIDDHIKSKGISAEARKDIAARIRQNVEAKVASGMQETAAWRSLGMLGPVGTSKNMAAITRAAMESPGAMDKVMGSILTPADAAKAVVPKAEAKATPAAAKAAAAPKPTQKPAAAPKPAPKPKPEPKPAPKPAPKPVPKPKPEPKPVAKPAPKPKPAVKHAAKPAEEKKKETARKTAEKKVEQSRKQQDRQRAAAPKPKPIKPMSQKDQRQELIKASGYTKGSGAANAYESILKKGVDPETARGVVEDGRKSGIKGQQLEKYANSRQKGADHDVAKASATPKKPASVRAASSSGSSGSGRRGGGTSRGTRSGGGSPGRRLPSGMGAAGGSAGGGKIMGSTSASALGADKGIVGAARNSIGQITQSLLTAQVIQRVGGIIQQITGGLIGFNMKLEESAVAFKTLFINEQRAMGTFFGDTQEATAKAAILTKQIQDFANVTPFRFGELVTAAERMKAFGFETREILPSLRGIGDAVAALGGEDDKLRRITYALGQMKQAGRVYQNDMMQLSNAGIAGYEILAKGLITEFVQTGKVMLQENGKIYKYSTDDINVVVNDLIKNQGKGAYTVASAQSEKFNQIFERIFTDPVEAIRQFTKRGNIDGQAAARVIIQGLEQTYRGGMDQLSRTMQGSISTVQDTSQFIIASSFKPIYDELRNALYSAGQFMMGPGAMVIAEGIAATIEPIGKTMTKVIPEAISAFGSFIKTIAKASANASKSIASIQVGARSLADYIKGTLGAGIKSIVDLIKTDFGQAAITATFAIATISKVVTANPIIIGLVALVGAFGAITESMQNVMKMGMPTAQAFATISKEEQDTARAGFEVREAFAEMGRTIRRVKQDMGPSIGKILTAISRILAKVGSQGIKVTVQAIEKFITVATAIMQKIEPFSGQIAAILVTFLSFKIANQGITKLTSVMNALAMSITSVAGAAIAIRSGGILAVIRGALGGNISNTAINAAIPAARGAKAARTGLGAAGGVKEIAQTQIKAFETGTKARPINLGSATTAVGDLLATIFGVGGKAKKTQLRGPDGKFIKGVAQAGAELSKFARVAKTVISVISFVGRAFIYAGRFIAVWIIIVPAIIDNIGGIVKMFGSFVSMIGRAIGAIGQAVGGLVDIVTPIKALIQYIGELEKALSNVVGFAVGRMTYLMDNMFPETEAEKATRLIALYNDEYQRFIEIGMSAPDAEKNAQYSVEVQQQMETKRKEIEKAAYDRSIQEISDSMLENMGPVGPGLSGILQIGGRIIGLGLGGSTTAEQEELANFQKTSTAFVDDSVAAYTKINEVVNEYKQKLMSAGITEEQAGKAAASIEAEILINIETIKETAFATGDYTAALGELSRIAINTASKITDITDAAKIAGIEIENLASGDTEVTIFDSDGMMEKFTVFGKNAQMVRDIQGQMKAYTDQLQNDLVSTGIISQADATAQATARIDQLEIRLAQATDGYYTGADGVREYLGQTEALSRLLKEVGYALGTVDTGELWIAQLEDELEKAKAAAEKIKAKIDPIVDAIIKRIQMSAEDQFAERLKNATTLLEQQRDAEIDAINVRVNGINQTYGLLDREIKAQEKKNRVLQIEKAILDAKKNVATAAIGAYGENVDPIEAAQRRREAEIAITEATKTAEVERSKLALDEQQTTVEAIQSIFDIRISIITDAIDAEKMAFQEAIDFLVEKIKNGEIKGTAAVKALQNAFTTFGIAVPRTVQSIAASGTTPIGNLFDQLSRSVDLYYNKLKRIKAIEDTIGSTIDTGAPTQDEIDEATRTQATYDQIDRNSIVSGMKTSLYQIMQRVSQAAAAQIRTGIGTDGKPISANTLKAREALYAEFAKATAAMPRGANPSQSDIDKFQVAVTKFVGYLQRPAVDLYSAGVGGPIYQGLPPRAKGGPVNSRGQYLVGEKGPELLTIGNGSGQVISNFYVQKLTDAFKSFRIGNPAIMPKMAYNMGGGGKAELSVTINNPQVRTDADIDKIVDAVNKSQMRMARRLGYS